jgi:hypothetical protein
VEFYGLILDEYQAQQELMYHFNTKCEINYHKIQHKKALAKSLGLSVEAYHAKKELIDQALNEVDREHEEEYFTANLDQDMSVGTILDHPSDIALS